MSTETAPYRARMSIRLGEAVLSLIESGQLAGNSKSLPVRLETLAARYTAIIASAVPALRPAQWGSIARIAGTLDSTHPSAHIAMQALLRADKSDHRLAFTAESLKPAEIYAIIAVAERLIASGVDAKDEAAVQSWLEAAAIPLAKAP